MWNKIVFTLILVTCMAALSSCEWFGRKKGPSIANPASVYCEEHSGKLEMRQDVSGGTIGICVFEDKSECEEWAYYRGECKPGDVFPK